MQLWTPSSDFIRQSNISNYIQWLKDKKDLVFSGYEELWQWSVDQTDEFWTSLFQYFSILYDGEISQVTNGKPMPNAEWFPGISLSYAEHIFSRKSEDHPAIIFKSEQDDLKEVSWRELTKQVGSLQKFLKDQGVVQGDRVAAYLPCVPEATVAFLATNSLGAVWSSCSPDFGIQAVIDRFAQIEPSILIAVDKYNYGGKVFDKTETVEQLINALPSAKTVIIISEKGVSSSGKKLIVPWTQVVNDDVQEPEFVRVPFSHPIWVVYSSGTTGLPKAIVHSQGGILLEQLKYCLFHNDYKPGERCFWFTTTGWMMWNYIHGSLLAGATMVLYDGNPAHPDLEVLWKFVDDAGINHFGTSAGFILANMKAGIEPSVNSNLTSLRSIGSTGSTLPVEGFEWIYRHVKKDVWLTSMSGGTDVASAFVGGNPTLPVYAGEIQCRALGCSLEAFNDLGKPVLNEVGEMVITKPMPSMPVYFWNDPEFKRYRESYFEMFPGIWRHGDWIKITENKGIIIYGRSDATLNRGGVRIGTSEIYRAVDKIEEVKDSLIICVEKDGGKFWMPLFVVMQDGVSLTDDVKARINNTLRNDYSPRHVPDEIILVPDIPYTVSGKKTETPVKKVLMGKNPDDVVNAGSLRNPASIKFFADLAKE
ncbi:MAG TPA: acetoacetate--CoA ligase [Chryseolinea sp.]|nr:acetoacetate--CoA ligase [Chryseolinea sp.]